MSVAVERQLAEKYESIAPLLDERQRRRWLGIEARALGRGGVSAVARATGASRTTVTAALAELAGGGEDSAAGRVRRAGAGRPPVSERDPGVAAALERLVDPATRGDPESPLRWTSKSTRTLADELHAQGHSVAPRTVAKLLHESGYSLQATRKTREGGDHPDRDAQFRYLTGHINAHLGSGDPVVSVDTKKKELVGRYKNAGREWQPTGKPEQVEVYDFIGEAGKAIPYGVYDVAANAAWVSVGRDHDTAAFAVATLHRWWQAMGRPGLTHENCPRNTLGASRKNAREMVTVVRHGEWVVDEVSRGDHRQVRQGVCEGLEEGQGADSGSGGRGDRVVA